MQELILKGQLRVVKYRQRFAKLMINRMFLSFDSFVFYQLINLLKMTSRQATSVKTFMSSLVPLTKQARRAS